MSRKQVHFDPRTAFEMELFQTKLKWVGLLWHGEYLSRLSFFHESKLDCSNAIIAFCGSPPHLRGPMSELARRVIAYSQGESMSFTDIKVEPALTDFSTRVRAFVQTIPYGAVQTYGAVSKAVGSPRSARAVGTVMRTNPVPLVVPCHRVVGTGNRLVGFSAGTGVSLKNQLLKLEGNKEQFVL